MEVNQIAKLHRGKPVWVWIVRMAQGEWCPRTIERIAVLEPFPILETRFDCLSTRGMKGMTKQGIVGISTSRMRHLEFRDPHLKGKDRPSFIPASLLVKPEEKRVSKSTKHGFQPRSEIERSSQLLVPDQ